DEGALAAPRLGGRFRNHRQVNSEGGAFFLAAIHLDAAAVILDDAVGDGKAEPRAHARLLGREKRIENFRKMLLLDAASVVAKIDAQPTVFPLEGGDPDGSSPIQGVAGVAGQV